MITAASDNHQPLLRHKHKAMNIARVPPLLWHKHKAINMGQLENTEMQEWTREPEREGMPKTLARPHESRELKNVIALSMQ